MTAMAYIVAQGQVTEKPSPDTPWRGPEPISLMVDAARRAIDDVGVPGIEERIDAIACVESFALQYEELEERIGGQLGLKKDLRKFWVPIGGNSPQDLLHDICTAITEGEIECALMTGAEAMYSRSRSDREGLDLGWPDRPLTKTVLDGQGPFSSDLETRHGMFLPIQAFPMFENAIRAAEGRTHEEQQEIASKILGRNAAVAKENPYAWFSDGPTAEEIAAVTPDNRMICHPYTKRMNAIMNVDQGASLVLMSERLMKELGLEDRAAAVLGGTGVEDIWFLSQRRTFERSLAMDLAMSSALDLAGVTEADLDGFDFYSCFPSAIQFAMSALGIDADDARPNSFTGGLAFAGGPGNSYVLGAAAAALGLLREGSHDRVLMTGVGMACAKLTATALARPGAIPEGATGRTPKRTELGQTPIEIDESPQGNAAIDTYTIEYERDGTPGRVIYILGLEDGRRTVANAADAPAAASVLLRDQPIGLRGTVGQSEDGTNIFEIAG